MVQNVCDIATQFVLLVVCGHIGVADPATLRLICGKFKLVVLSRGVNVFVQVVHLDGGESHLAPIHYF